MSAAGVRRSPAWTPFGDPCWALPAPRYLSSALGLHVWTRGSDGALREVWSTPKVVFWSPWHGLQLLSIRNVVTNPITVGCAEAQVVGRPWAGSRHRMTHRLCGAQLKQAAAASLAAKQLLPCPLEAGGNGKTPSKC